MGASGDNHNTKNEISFRCTYDIKDINDNIQIINDRLFDESLEKYLINKEIKSKVKILNGDKKEELIFKKKFNQIGINTIDFIIEETLTNMSFMFFNCNSLKKIEFISFDTSKVTSMKGMFYKCKELEYLDLSNFNTSKVEEINVIFKECLKLKEIKGITNLNTNKVTCMLGMFCKCEELEYLDLSNFNTSKVEHYCGIFKGCSKLKEIKGINQFNSSKVECMALMFKDC